MQSPEEYSSSEESEGESLLQQCLNLTSGTFHEGLRGLHPLLSSAEFEMQPPSPEELCMTVGELRERIKEVHSGVQARQAEAHSLRETANKAYVHISNLEMQISKALAFIVPWERYVCETEMSAAYDSVLATLKNAHAALKVSSTVFPASATSLGSGHVEE